MLIFGKDILNKKIVSSEYEEAPEHKVEDLLLNKRTFDLEYIIYVEKRPEKEIQENRVETSMDNVVNSVGGHAATNTSPVTNDDTFFKSYTKETLYIPFSDVKELSDDMVRISGIDQQYHDPVDSLATEAIIHKKVKTESGETVGKVQDVVIDWESRRVVALSLSEGFWANLMSDTNRYMRLEDNMDLATEHIIVPNHVKDHLLEEVKEVQPR